MSDVQISTTSFPSVGRIMQHKGFISCNTVRGVNIVRDMFTSVRDVIGGRSGSYQAVVAEMEVEVLREIVSRARKMGANGVVGFHIEFDNIGSKGKSLMMAYGQGTAVLIDVNHRG